MAGGDAQRAIKETSTDENLSVQRVYLLLAGVEHYKEIKGISICEFLPPHLSIYIDQPAEEVQKKLKQSGKVATRGGPPTVKTRRLVAALLLTATTQRSRSVSGGLGRRGGRGVRKQ